jgi:hypothetical protein
MMVGVEKPARCANIEQAAYQKLQNHFTIQTIRRGNWNLSGWIHGSLF